jgi:hypothetical protein
MASLPFLVEHAMQNVWAQPIQDKQHVIKMARYTSASGNYRSFKIKRNTIDLPKAADGADVWHHVYQIGALSHPMLLSLTGITTTWARGDTFALTNGAQFDFFTESGLHIPLIHCWIRRLEDNNVLLAVEIREGFDLGERLVVNDNLSQTTAKRVLADEALYFRSYLNAKAQTLDWANTTNSTFRPISYVYKLINNSVDFINFLNAVNAAKTLHKNLGRGRYYLDGFLVGPQTAYKPTIHNGHYITYIHDETVRYDGFAAFSDLGTFTSQKDAQTAKLLLLVNEAVNDLSINYHDDVDFFLCNRNDLNDSNRGIYVGRVRGDLVRQVTQNAYALRTASINALISAHADDIFTSGDVYIRYVVRDGGARKGLPFQRERLNDLYKMPLTNIKQAMYGANATVDVWKAANLENSDYMKVVSGFFRDLNVDLIAAGYGYPAMMSVGYNEVLKPNNGVYKINKGYLTLPYTDTINGSMFTYDANGHLVDYRNVALGNTSFYNADVGVAKAEFFPLPVSENYDGTYLNQDLTSSDLVNYGFRLYVCATINGVPQNVWQDVTENDIWYTYTVKDGVGSIVWNATMLAATKLYSAIKVGNKVHCYQYKPPMNQGGAIRFSIQSTQFVKGVETVQVQTIPSDTVDVFLDNVPLIEDIDYYVRFPEIVIVKRNLKLTTDSVITVRHYGLVLSTDRKRREPKEVGFTKAGILSVDGNYDLRNDRNIRIIVEGSVKTRDEVKFAEGMEGVTVPDGRPYSISEYRFPVQTFANINARAVVVDTEAIDVAVGDYLSDIINPVINQRGFIDGDRYQVVSPLISRLLYEMTNNNFLNNGELDNVTMTGNLVESLAANYWDYLVYEPIKNGVDVYYVNILPHPYPDPLEVTVKQYVFLEYIINLYLQDSIDLTPYVKIKTVSA